MKVFYHSIIAIARQFMFPSANNKTSSGISETKFPIGPKKGSTSTNYNMCKKNVSVNGAENNMFHLCLVLTHMAIQGNMHGEPIGIEMHI